jgi:hypothetical protein
VHDSRVTIHDRPELQREGIIVCVGSIMANRGVSFKLCSRLAVRRNGFVQSGIAQRVNGWLTLPARSQATVAGISIEKIKENVSRGQSGINSLLTAENEGNINAENVADLLYLCGKSRPGTISLREHLPALTRILRENSSRLSEASISNLLYGFKVFGKQLSDERNKNFKDFVYAVGESITLAKLEKMKAINISKSFVGMRYLNSEYNTTKKLLFEFARLIRDSNDRFGVQEIGSVMFGLQLCSNEHTAVRNILNAMAPKVAACTGEIFSVAQISNCLFGLKSMSAADPRTIFDFESLHTIRELMKVLKELNDLFKKTVIQNMMDGGGDLSHQEIKTKDLVNALYGMRGLSSEHKEVRETLKTLCVLFKQQEALVGDTSFSAAHVGMVMFSLSNKDPNFRVVQSLLKILAQKIRTCRDPLDASTVAAVVFGLQSMNAEILEVRELIDSVNTLLAANVPTVTRLSPQDIGMIITGIKGLTSDCTNVRELISLLDRLLIHSCGTEPQFRPWQLANIYRGLSKMRNNCSEVNNLLQTLADVLHKSSIISYRPGAKTQLSRWDISECVAAFGNLTNVVAGVEQKPVSDLLGRLPSLIRGCTIKLHAKDIGYALSGLNGCCNILNIGGVDTRITSVCELLEVLNKNLLICAADEFDGEVFANVIHGMQQMSYMGEGGKDARNILITLLERYCKREPLPKLTSDQKARVLRSSLVDSTCTEDVVKDILTFINNQKI